MPVSLTIPMPWRGDECSCGTQPHVVVWSPSALWRGDEWLVIRQPHRGYTFDSPGLPTIGGYPGEQGVRDATPLGVVLSFCVQSNASHVIIRGVASS